MKIDEDSNQLRPSLMQIQSELRRTKHVTWVLAFFMAFFFIIIWPIMGVSFDDFSYASFRFWIIIGQTFIFASCVFFLVGPFVEYYMMKILEIIKRSKQILGIDMGKSLDKLPTDYVAYRRERQKRESVETEDNHSRNFSTA